MDTSHLPFWDGRDATDLDTPLSQHELAARIAQGQVWFHEAWEQLEAFERGDSAPPPPQHD